VINSPGHIWGYLVVILIYSTIRSFVKINPHKVGDWRITLSCLIEVLQYLKIVDRLCLSANLIAITVMGYRFEWWDILAYTLE